MDWLYFCAVQGTLKSLLWHHSSKASVLQCSAFFIVQLSHPCMTTGKTIALTTRNFVGKVMCLIFNMLSRLIIAFLPRSQCLLIGNYEPEEYRKKKEILDEREDKKPWNRNEKRNQGSKGKSVQDFLLDDKSLHSSSLGQTMIIPKYQTSPKSQWFKTEDLPLISHFKTITNCQGVFVILVDLDTWHD